MSQYANLIDVPRLIKDLDEIVSNPALTLAQRGTVETAALAISAIERELDEAREADARIAIDLTGYTGEGTEDRNDGFGMFARGVRFAKLTIAKRIRARTALASKP